MASNKITITYNKKEYTLEFNRSTAQLTERRGFIAKDIEFKPVTMVPILVEGAFLAHHSNLKSKTVEEIYERLGKKSELVGKLLKMYMDTVNALIGSDEEDEEEGTEKNAGWEASWTEK